MNKQKRLLMIGFLLVSFLLPGCGPSQILNPTTTSTPIPTPIPTLTLTPVPPTFTPTLTLTPIPPTFTPIPTQTPIPISPTPTSLTYLPFPSEINSTGKINTSIGTIVITKAEIVSQDISGNTPSPGYQILQIWFDGADGSKINAGGFFDALEGVYLVGDDGSQTQRYSGGGINNKLLAAFTPPTTAKKFWLYWPNNLPVELKITK